jgi:hypothetical protein
MASRSERSSINGPAGAVVNQLPLSSDRRGARGGARELSGQIGEPDRSTATRRDSIITTTAPCLEPSSKTLAAAEEARISALIKKAMS